MRDPMVMDGATNPHLIWVGYPTIAGGERFYIQDNKEKRIFVYVPLDKACRFVMNPTDTRKIWIRFHIQKVHEDRLKERRLYYSSRAAQSLELWDHEKISPTRGNNDSSSRPNIHTK